MFPKKILSLDIGTKNTKIIVGKYEKNKIYLDRAVTIETPLHSIEDGHIVDKARLASELKNELGIHSIKAKDANCTTNSTSVIYREITIPKAEEGELDTMVKYEIQQYLPIIMEDYIVQHSVLETVKDENTPNSVERYKVLAVTYPKVMAQDYLKLLQEVGLKPNALDVNFNSINKLFKNDVNINGEMYTTEETAAVIDMGAETITINIFLKGRMEFSRIITVGGNIIDNHIAREYDITLEEAEKRKKQYCDLLGENEAQRMDELNGVIKEDVNNWLEEINRIIRYYKNKQVGNKIDKIYIHGGSSRLKGLEGYMSRLMNTPVIRISSMDNIILGKEVNNEDLDLYLNAIGSIIRL